MPPVSTESVSLHPEPIKFKSKRIIWTVLAFLGVVLVATIAINSPLLFVRAKYALNIPVKGAPPPASEAASGVSEINIPDIDVKAPVVYGTDASNNGILNDLHNGVAHYPNTALPGQPGNVVIFGHSSEDWWDTGKYKFIFVLLDKLKVGSQVYVDYQGHQYTYEITGSQVVPATYMAALDPTAQPTLTLITCSPVGTSLRRLIVTATQISPALQPPVPVAVPAIATPAPATTTAATPAPVPSAAPVSTQTTLPSSNGVTVGLLNTIEQGWNAIIK